MRSIDFKENEERLKMGREVDELLEVIEDFKSYEMSNDAKEIYIKHLNGMINKKIRKCYYLSMEEPFMRTC